MISYDLAIGKDHLVCPALSRQKGTGYIPGARRRTPNVNADPPDLCMHFVAVFALACSDDQEQISIVEQLVQT